MHATNLLQLKINGRMQTISHLANHMLWLMAKCKRDCQETVLHHEHFCHKFMMHMRQFQEHLAPYNSSYEWKSWRQGVQSHSLELTGRTVNAVRSPRMNLSQAPLG